MIELYFGDVMFDAALHFGNLADTKAKCWVHLVCTQSFTLATIHRAENTDGPKRLDAIFRGSLNIPK